MQTISIQYSLKWEFKYYPNYKITSCKKVVNCKTGKIKKQCLNGGSIGYWISKTFIPKSKLNDHIELIKQCFELPF